MGKIGVLDSGLGGMVMLEQLKRRYPDQDFIFLADQIHSPYGHRTQENLIEIVNQNIAWLKKKGADSILMACNTISCLDEKRIDDSIPVQRVIEPTCRQLMNQSIHSVLVCATPFTVSTQSYGRVLSQLCPDLRVESLALPYLCTDIEELVPYDIVRKKLRSDLNPYAADVDAVILGCTHYPVVKSLFQEIMNVPVFDSNGIELIHASKGTGQIEYFTTDDPDYFDSQCERLFHVRIHSQKIEL